MNIEKGKISGFEFTFLIIGFIQGSLLLVSFISALTKHDTWLVALFSLLPSSILLISYTSIAKMFPGMNLVQINDIVYGKYLGKAVSISYVYFFISILSFNTRNFADFYITFLMPETPLNFFLIIFVSVYSFAVWKGIEIIGRITPLLVAVVAFIIIFMSTLLINEMDFSNFLPVFEIPVIRFLQGIHAFTVILFGEIIIFLTIMPALNTMNHAARNTFLGLLVGAVSFLFIVIRNTSVLGPTEIMSSSSSFQAARLIEVGNVFSRMDIFIGIAHTITLFLKCGILYYAVVISLAQLLGLKSYLTIVPPLSGIIVILAASAWKSSVEINTWGQSSALIFSTPFVILLPLLTLLIAKVRGFKKQVGKNR